MHTIRKQILHYGAAIGLTLAAAAVAAHPGQMGGGMRHGGGQSGGQHGMHQGGVHGMGMHSGAQAGAMPCDAQPGQTRPQTGQTLMTPEERQRIAQANHAEMEKRAKEQGTTLPEQRGPHARQGGHDPMTRHTAMLTRQDAGSRADMGLVHELLMNHARIERTVTNLPNGIRTVTESDDLATTRAIQAHVASMSQRLQEGRDFNIFSNTLPVLFDQRDKITSSVQMTANGAVVTHTSTDAKIVAALQGHAGEVSELVKDGMAGFHRGMQKRMAAGTAPAR